MSIFLGGDLDGIAPGEAPPPEPEAADPEPEQIDSAPAAVPVDEPAAVEPVAPEKSQAWPRTRCAFPAELVNRPKLRA